MCTVVMNYNYRKKGRYNQNRFRPDIFLRGRGMPDEVANYVARIGKQLEPQLPIHTSRYWQ